MPPNLRSVIERVTRGGRSVVSSRNFSSYPNCSNDSKEAGGRVVDASRLKSSLETRTRTRTKSDHISRSFVYGLGFFAALDLYKSNARYKARQEEFLRSLRDRQVLNAGQDDSTS